MRWIILLALTFWLAKQTNGQFYVTGQEPYGTKWREKNSSFGKLIFSDEIDSLASVFNYYVKHSLNILPHSLNHYPSKFPIVLHGNSIISNGFVSWAPKRMEIVSTPSLDATPEPWLFRLALHETRHIIQISKLNNGFFKVGSFLLGEQSVGLALAFVPPWFLEGDAVYTETAHSKGGRGRIASFYGHYLAHFVTNNGSKFNYDKWLLGSYKDYVPSHYNFGYQMVGYTNLTYGSNIWSNALDRITKRPYSILPFFISFKKDIGKSTKQVFSDIVLHYDSLWHNIKDTIEIKDYKELINKNIKDVYADYRYPFLQNDTTLIALKTSLKKTARIVSVDLLSGKETLLHNPGYITQRLSYSNNTIYWSQYSAHSRWEYQNYSEVWLFDLNSNRAKRVSRQTRYFNPIGYKSETVAVVETSVKGEHFITVINKNGQRLASVVVPPTLELKEICAGEDDEIYARCSSPNGMVILWYKNLESSPDTVLGPVYRDISNIQYNSGKLFFTMTHDFCEEVFSFNLLNRDAYRVSKSRFGLTNFSVVSNEKMVASKLSVKGYTPAIVPLDYSAIVDIFEEALPFFEINPNEKQIGYPKDFSSVISEKLTSRKHQTFKNLFHIHSWAPLYYNPSDLVKGNFDLYPGATIISQNSTSTLVSSVGYSYNKTHGLHANFDWLGWYPKFSFGFDYGNVYNQIAGGPLANDTSALNNSPAQVLRTRVSVPYNLSSGYLVSEARFGLQYFYSNSWVWDTKNTRYRKGVDGIEPYVHFYIVSRMALRDLRPRWGGYFYAGSLTSPSLSTLYGRTSIARASLYLPGFFANQSLLLSGQFESQNIEQRVRASRTTPMRGYYDSFAKTVYTSSVDYAFPFAYVDLPISSLIYFKRLFANVFSDNAWLLDSYVRTASGIETINQTQHSIGLEINADVNFLRSSFPFRIGYRSGYLLREKSYFHDFILGFNIGGAYGYNSNNHFLNINL